MVDSHEVNRDSLCSRLEREGHTVAAAGDGRQALQMIQSQPFDLVLLALLRPGLNGWQVLEQLQANSAIGYLPVIMISALNDKHNLRCIGLGADDFLLGPADPELLRVRIKACLEKKRLYDQIVRAEKRADELLHAVFPEPIARGLKGMHRPAPRRHENVAVLFADIVNFTPFCDRHEPEEVVWHLDQLVRRGNNAPWSTGCRRSRPLAMPSWPPPVCSTRSRTRS